MSTEITVEISDGLYNTAKEKLDMSFNEFVEYALTVFMSTDNTDEYARNFRKGCRLLHDFDNVKKKLHKLSNDSYEEDYSHCLEIVDRIHYKLGYIGRNQLRKIANTNNVSPVGLISLVENMDKYNVQNFGDAPK